MFWCLDTKRNKDATSSSKSPNPYVKIHDKGKIVDEGIHHADECERKNGRMDEVFK